MRCEDDKTKEVDDRREENEKRKRRGRGGGKTMRDGTREDHKGEGNLIIKEEI